MFTKLSSNRLFILFVAIFGLFLFYWFAVRPAQIKHDCYQNTIKAVKDTKSSEGMSVYYEFCLHDKGL